MDNRKNDAQPEMIQDEPEIGIGLVDAPIIEKPAVDAAIEEPTLDAMLIVSPDTANTASVDAALTGADGAITKATFNTACDVFDAAIDTFMNSSNVGFGSNINGLRDELYMLIEKLGDESKGGVFADLTGTGVPTTTELQAVAGGNTIIITLTGDTWDATVGADNAITDALILGITSAQSGAAGWNAVVRANMVFGDVTRTSSTIVTIILAAEAAFAITADETITVTIPASALTGGLVAVATPVITVTAT